jgi:ComF family protein
VDGENGGTICAVHCPQILRDVADFLMPGRCAACGDDCNGGDFLCYRCEAGLDQLAGESACRLCALPVVRQGAPCPWCRGGGTPPFQQIVRLGRLVDPLRPVIHAMKYRRRWALAEQLAERLLAEQRVQELVSRAEVLVAAPLHWARRLGRGYNQAEILAVALGRRRGLQSIGAVKRIRRTLSQTAIHSRTVREENVRGAFALTPAAAVLAGKQVIVVDDVMTTSATLCAVGRALQSAGPAGLSALVLAVADPKGRDFQAV